MCSGLNNMTFLASTQMKSAGLKIKVSEYKSIYGYFISIINNVIITLHQSIDYYFNTVQSLLFFSNIGN